MKVRLIRKFAPLINGIDLSKANQGETLDLSTRDATLLVAEGWAELAPDRDHADERQGRKRSRVGSKKKR